MALELSGRRPDRLPLRLRLRRWFSVESVGGAELVRGVGACKAIFETNVA